MTRILLFILSKPSNKLMMRSLRQSLSSMLILKKVSGKIKLNGLLRHDFYLTFSESEIQTLELLKNENLLIIGNEEDHLDAKENSQVVFPRRELSLTSCRSVIMMLIFRNYHILCPDLKMFLKITQGMLSRVLEIIV